MKRTPGKRARHTCNAYVRRRDELARDCCEAYARALGALVEYQQAETRLRYHVHQHERNAAP